MSFPPPPQDPHGSGAAGSGGGFGPPQGFGPPEQPGPPQGYGYPGQPGGGFGQPPGPGGPPGGPGQPPYGGGPQPPPGGNNGAKVAAIVVGAVLVLGLAVGGVILATGDDDGDDKADSKNTPSASSEPSGRESDTGPSPEESSEDPETEEPTEEPTPDASSSDLVPFVVLDPGQCFDHPSLSSDVTEVTKRSCDGPHNGEVIANDKLTGSFSTEKDLQAKVLELCKADATERLKTIPQDGRNYYFYAIYPSLDTYKERGQDTISCSLTLSNSLDGTKLTKPLPG